MSLPKRTLDSGLSFSMCQITARRPPSHALRKVSQRRLRRPPGKAQPTTYRVMQAVMLEVERAFQLNVGCCIACSRPESILKASYKHGQHSNTSQTKDAKFIHLKSVMRVTLSPRLIYQPGSITLRYASPRACACFVLSSAVLTQATGLHRGWGWGEVRWGGGR